MDTPVGPDPVTDYLAAKQAAKQSSQNSNSATGHITDPVTDYLAAKQAQQTTAPAAPARSKNSTAYNALNTVDNALTFGLGQKFNAAWNAGSDVLHGRDSFGSSYQKNLASEHQGIDQFRNEHPIASGVAAGVGSTIPVLVAGPAAEEAVIAKSLPRAARIANGARVGAGAGAVNALGNSQNTSSVGDQFSTAAKGAAAGAVVGGAAATAAETIPLAWRIAKAKTTGAAAVEQDEANTAANITNYGKVAEEGKQTPTTPAVKAALAHPEIQPFADKFRASTRGQGASDAEVLRNAFKGLSRNQMALEQRMAAKIGDYDYDAELKIGDLKAAKKVIKQALSSPSEKPPITMDVPADVHETEANIVPGREGLDGPPASGPLAGYTRPPHPSVSQALRDNPHGPTPSPALPAVPGETGAMQGPGGPTFRMPQKAAQVVSPGVRIDTPGMRVQTAPAEALPPMMPSYQKAVQDYADRSKEIDALKRGYQVLQQNSGRSKLPPVNNLGRKTPLSFEEWAKTASPQELAAARQGITGGVRDAAALKNGLTLKPFRDAVSAAGPLLRVAPSPDQAWLDAGRNLGLLTAGNSSP